MFLVLVIKPFASRFCIFSIVLFHWWGGSRIHIKGSLSQLKLIFLSHHWYKFICIGEHKISCSLNYSPQAERVHKQFPTTSAICGHCCHGQFLSPIKSATTRQERNVACKKKEHSACTISDQYIYARNIHPHG